MKLRRNLFRDLIEQVLISEMRHGRFEHRVQIRLVRHFVDAGDGEIRPLVSGTTNDFTERARDLILDIALQFKGG